MVSRRSVLGHLKVCPRRRINSLDRIFHASVAAASPTGAFSHEMLKQSDPHPLAISSLTDSCCRMPVSSMPSPHRIFPTLTRRNMANSNRPKEIGVCAIDLRQDGGAVVNQRIFAARRFFPSCFRSGGGPSPSIAPSCRIGTTLPHGITWQAGLANATAELRTAMIRRETRESACDICRFSFGRSGTCLLVADRVSMKR